jgi:hypothetical protein
LLSRAAEDIPRSGWPARRFIDGLPQGAVVRVSTATATRDRYIATYQGMSLKISRQLRDELLASGRGVEDS